MPGRPLWQFLCLRQSPIPVISAACQGNEAGAFCGCLHESLNARYALLEWYRLVWFGMVCCALLPCWNGIVWCGVPLCLAALLEWYRLVWCGLLCCLAGVRRVSKESKHASHNMMIPLQKQYIATAWSQTFQTAAQILNIRADIC